MQKKLIALAIAGLSSAAFAQSNVTIYGVADVAFENSSATGATQNAAGTLTAVNAPGRNRVTTNSSLIGFKGAESIGNGLTAVFQMETTANMDGAGAALFGAQRDTYVGIAGSFGTVAAGYLSGPYRNALASMEVAPGATGPAAGLMNLMGKALTTPGAVGTVNANNTVSGYTVTAARVQNTVAYITPNFSGLQATLAYSTGPLAADAKTAGPTAANTGTINQTAATFGVNYDNGPLKARFAYQSIRDLTMFANDATTNAIGELTTAGYTVANNTAGGSKADSWLLGAEYTFGGATSVGIVYDSNKVTSSNTSAGGGVTAAPLAGNFRITGTKQTAWALTAKHKMGAHNIGASYAKVGNGKVDTLLGTGTVLPTNIGQNGASQFSLRYGYDLSKRSQLYAFYSMINNQSGAAYDFTTQALGGGQNNGADPRSIGVGMRHSF